MKDERRHSHPAASAIVTGRRQHQENDHHHHLSHVKPSPEPHASKYAHVLHDAYHSLARPVFKHEHLTHLASVSTDREPLMGSDSSTTSVSGQTSQAFGNNASFTDRYGRCLEILHYGTNTTVRLHQRKPMTRRPASKQMVAIKVYRYSILDSGSACSAHTSTCSPSSVSVAHPHHPNILPIIDLLYNERAELCIVTPYCASGNLCGLLSRTGPLPTPEADCVVAQMLRALAFLHQHDTAHRNVSLETVLLTAHGAVKLAGFSDNHIRRLWTKCAVRENVEEPTSHARRTGSPPHTRASWSFSLPWPLSSFSWQSLSARSPSLTSDSSTAFVAGLRLPYIPPEEFHAQNHYSLHSGDNRCEGAERHDHRPADIWATAVIYIALVTSRLPWRSAHPHREDSRYLEYLRGRNAEDGYPPIESLGNRRRNTIYAMLHPIARERITAAVVLRSEWMDGVKVCEAGSKGYY